MELLSPGLRMQSPMPLIREPQFYVDECLDSDCFVEVLESAWIKVVRHRDLFEKGISDEVWMKKSSEMGYYPLTYDYKIAQSENQTKFVMDMCLGLFIIGNYIREYPKNGTILFWRV